MAEPVRIQLSRRKGWKLQEHSHAVNGLPAQNVDRNTRWGNPHTISGGCSQAESIERFRVHAGEIAAVKPEWLARLRGKNLACWCALPKPGKPDMCHAAVLLEIANAR